MKKVIQSVGSSAAYTLINTSCWIFQNLSLIGFQVVIKNKLNKY
jgi:hypothetical protein